MSKYLDESGVSYLWGKIKALNLPNPNAMSVYYDSTKAFDYDGSAAKTLSIKSGSNITVTGDSTGDITIAGTPDTKNTAGSTQSSSKLYIVGATSQGANPQTYSNVNVYINSNKLYSNNTEVSVVGHSHVISDVTGLQDALDDLADDISLIPKFSIEVVQQLPTTDISKTTIYLVPSAEGTSGNLYTEYIRVTKDGVDVWEKLGEQALDISGKINGLSSVTSGDIVTWGANGTTVQDSGVSIVTTIADNDTTIPTGAAIEDYVETAISTNAVTSVATGVGLTGGPITTTGTIKANLKSETALTTDSVSITDTAGRTYAVSADHSGYLATNVPWTDTHVNVTSTTSKNYLLGTTTSPSATATATTSVANTGIYATGTTLTATNFSGKINNHTVESDVPANAEFTDTKVTQNVFSSGTNENHPILLSYYDSSSNTTTAQTVSRDNSVYINPSTHTLTTINLIATSITENGTALSSKYKSISYVPDWSEITNVPTGATNTLGVVKTTSAVDSTTGLTASPIIDGVVYYKDTDTHYTTHLYVTTASGTSTTSTALANGAVNLRLFDDTTARNTFSITGTGVTQVITDTSGNIIVDTPMVAITTSELDTICV